MDCSRLGNMMVASTVSIICRAHLQYLLHVPRMPHEQTKISMHEDFVSKAFYKLIVSVATAIHRHPRPCIRLDTRPSRSVQMRRFGRGDYVWKAPRSLEIA